MQSYSTLSQAASLYEGVEADERLFSDNFIQFQLAQMEQASREILQSGLLDGRKINAILNYMRDLWVDAKGNIYGKNDKKLSYPGLIHLITKTIDRLKQHYQWSGTHPLVPILEALPQHIANYIATMQPHLRLDSATSSNTIQEDDDLFAVTPADFVPSNERVFSNGFIKQQVTLITDASNFITDEGVLEFARIKMIMNYLRDLTIHTQHFTFSGEHDTAHNYYDLLQQIDQFIEEVKNKWKNKHPYYLALTQIKENILAVLPIAHPQSAARLGLSQVENLSNVTKARWEIVKDTCSILACLAWYIPEKIITVDNGCETLAKTPAAALCPELQLPQNNTYCSLWAPKNSIRALYQDAIKQSDLIDNLKAAPVRHTMK